MICDKDCSLKWQKSLNWQVDTTTLNSLQVNTISFQGTSQKEIDLINKKIILSVNDGKDGAKGDKGDKGDPGIQGNWEVKTLSFQINGQSEKIFTNTDFEFLDIKFLQFYIMTGQADIKSPFLKNVQIFNQTFEINDGIGMFIQSSSNPVPTMFMLGSITINKNVENNTFSIKITNDLPTTTLLLGNIQYSKLV